MTTSLNAVNRQRIYSIDVLRGLVMVVMALDHVRDFFHQGVPDPTNLDTTTPILFFTRWITHFCAPTFIFLCGVSAFLAGQRRTRAELSYYLVKRGLWLVLIELVVINFAFWLDPAHHLIVLQVLWVIGISMIILGLLVWFPMPVIVIVGELIFLGHNLFDYQHVHNLGISFLFTAGGIEGQSIVPIGPNRAILDAYAIMPWTGVMLLGYIFGQLYEKNFPAMLRQRIIIGISITLFVVFVVFRYFNIYGDPNPWHVQKTWVMSLVSFLNVTKYPCSLLFLCMTLSVGTLLLVVFERTANWFTRICMVYGSVPFFYYVLHFYLVRVYGIVLFFVFGFTKNDIMPAGTGFPFRPKEFGFGLPGVYLMWVVVVASLYLPCLWFSKYKKTHKQWWLSYL